MPINAPTSFTRAAVREATSKQTLLNRSTKRLEPCKNRGGEGRGRGPDWEHYSTYTMCTTQHNNVSTVHYSAYICDQIGDHKLHLCRARRHAHTAGMREREGGRRQEGREGGMRCVWGPLEMRCVWGPLGRVSSDALGCERRGTCMI